MKGQSYAILGLAQAQIKPRVICTRLTLQTRNGLPVWNKYSIKKMCSICETGTVRQKLSARRTATINPVRRRPSILSDGDRQSCQTETVRQGLLHPCHDLPQLFIPIAGFAIFHHAAHLFTVFHYNKSGHIGNAQGFGQGTVGFFAAVNPN
jgi:hypothetical protein